MMHIPKPNPMMQPKAKPNWLENKNPTLNPYRKKANAKTKKKRQITHQNKEQWTVNLQTQRELPNPMEKNVENESY